MTKDPKPERWDEGSVSYFMKLSSSLLFALSGGPAFSAFLPPLVKNAAIPPVDTRVAMASYRAHVSCFFLYQNILQPPQQINGTPASHWGVVMILRCSFGNPEDIRRVSRPGALLLCTWLPWWCLYGGELVRGVVRVNGWAALRCVGVRWWSSVSCES